MPELDQLRVVERGADLPARHRREALDPVEVGVLDGHHAGGGEDLFGEVVDELPVDETVDAVADDLAHLGAHLVPLGLLDLRHLGHRVHPHPGPVDLDLVRVHRRVGEHDFGVLDALGLPDADPLVEDEAVGQVRVAQRSAGLFDDLDVVEVSRASESQHSVHGQVGEVGLLVVDQLAREGRRGDGHQVRPELGVVRRVVHRHVEQGRAGDLRGLAPPVGDGLRVDPLPDEALGVPQELPAQDGHRGGAVPDLLVLDARDVHQHFRRGVVHMDRPQDRGAVVGDGDLTVLGGHGVQNLVHPFGAQRGLDQVRHRDRPHEGGHARVLALIYLRLRI
mmetsp:Transcript_31670/g.71199  ORF Transcript_31670/g.71199 Transcript_31670/m.71199 type:complete len:335 (+) Transcript_31670:910-1914(+)